MEMRNCIWYKKQAKEWIKGLPIGNGRLAAMVWGDECKDILSVNHEWLWRGVNKDRDNKNVSKHLPEVRKLLEKGDFFRATSLSNTFFGGMGGVSEIKGRVDAYQPAGDLVFEMENSKFDKRNLNMKEAVVTVNRRVDNNTVTGNFFAHPEYNLIICRWHSKKEKFSGSFYYTRVEDPQAKENISVDDRKIVFDCAFEGGIEYKTVVNIESDGKSYCDGNKLIVNEASYITAYINVAIGASGMEEEISRYPVPDVQWEELLSSHKKAFSKVYGKFRLEIDLPDADKPTDETVKEFKNGAVDPSLMLLLFNYGRYLLISSSISGDLPANLQGKWNEKINPAWDCDYHFDINLQMNYWMAEAANMSESVNTLLKFAESFIPHGRKAAKDLYGCRGIFLPIQTDAWGKATPESYGWAVWIGAAPWIAQHFWWHYDYMGDIEFLEQRAYPFFKEIAAFYEDYLHEDENGILQIMPSQSPENRFEGTGFWPVSIGISSAMDVQLAYDSLGYAIRAADILGTDAELVKKWSSIREKLPKLGIGSDGRLLEWDVERKEVEPSHRHISHLYGLYPSNIINPLDSPDLYEAAIMSLKHRLMTGGGHTGWSRAWVACIYSRIGDGGNLWNNLHELVKDFISENLLCIYKIYDSDIFQIDGNLGAVAAVLESIVQFWGGKTHLLRALPKAWSKSGMVEGLKVPGGHELKMSWKNGEIQNIEIIIGYSGEIIMAGLADMKDFCNITGKMHIEGKDIHFEGKPGEEITVSKKTIN